MMCTDHKQHAEEIVANINALLDESVLQQMFDEPVDRAVKTFLYQEEFPVNYQAFHRIVGNFARHIYEYGLKVPWKMSLVGPTATGLSLLENHYQGTYASGYAAARFDAVDPDQGGIQIVLHRVAEAVKVREREQYIRWVFARYLQGLDWQVRLRVTRIVLQRFSEFLPLSISQCPPAQMVEEVPALIQTFLAGDTTLGQIADSS